MSSSSSSQRSLTESERLERIELLRAALPECQPQEGSPANTFTTAELEELRTVMGVLNLGPHDADMNLLVKAAATQKMDILNPQQWMEPKDNQQSGQPQEEEVVMEQKLAAKEFEPIWHGAPKISLNTPSQLFRQQVRAGEWDKPTNAVCPGYLQCNLVVLPEGPASFDFLLFCQRNPQACPLIDVCDVGSPHPVGVAKGADLRTDVPKYAIYRDGVLEKEVTDVTDYWPENSVAFLIGCSFSYDGAFLDAGIPLRSADEGKNVPMYKTTLACRPAGCLKGNMVVSMKPIKAIDVAKEVMITSKYPHAHGPPVCVGNPKAIGIEHVDKPEWGDSIELHDDEVPVFHACGVTPQSVLMDSKVPFAITHSAGHMFITDLPSDLGK